MQCGPHQGGSTVRTACGASRRPCRRRPRGRSVDPAVSDRTQREPRAGSPACSPTRMLGMHGSLVTSAPRLAMVFLAAALLSCGLRRGERRHTMRARTADRARSPASGWRSTLDRASIHARTGTRPVQFLQQQVQIVNTTSTDNAYDDLRQARRTSHATVFLRQHAGPGGMTVCGAQSSQQLQGGFFQVVAAHPSESTGPGRSAKGPRLSYQSSADWTWTARRRADPEHRP